jgi:hypothetical protein
LQAAALKFQRKQLALQMERQMKLLQKARVCFSAIGSQTVPMKKPNRPKPMAACIEMA